MRNLAERGHGSRVASEFLLIRYPPGSSKSFRSTDIVFLDYSVNDCSGGYGPRVGTDIETLVRRFLHYGSDMPLVILLEGYPFQIAGQYFNWNIPGTGGVHDYTTYYRQVARYYNLPLWSFATSMFDNITVTQHFYPYIRNMASHPSWFVHLFMADLYSSVMKHQIHKYCVKEADQRKQEVLQISGTTSKMLPPTLYVGDEKECIPGNEHRQYHSNARTEYDRLRSSPIPPMDQDELEWEVYSEQTKEIVSSSSSPLHSDSPPVYGIWKLYEDRPTKAGWIINPAGDMEGASLRFRLQKVDFSAALVFPQSSQSDIFELMNMLEEHQFGYVVNYLVNSLLFGRIISNIVFL